ncbi:MAG: hypothetical protein HY304_02880 [candidate division Zixibacteria bacterium]|nr:hypothetical protein [candidate division Zixibacteria bacterium]
MPRRRRQGPWTILALGLAALNLPVGLRAQEWASRWSVSFMVEGADPDLEQETRAVLEEANEHMAAASGLALSDTIHVVYVTRLQSFDSVVGGHFPDWGVACAASERELIAVRSPRDHPIGRELAEILRHELAHLHLDHLTGLRQVPRWMQEGYAQQLAHEWRFGDDWIVARAVFSDQTISLADIDGVNSFQDVRARLAYGESYLAMGYFLDRYGWDGLLLFAEGLRRKGDWDQAFQSATGADYAVFQREFAAYLRGKYNWIAFFGDTVLLWLGLVALFLVLYVMKRRRGAAKLAEWEAQEAIEDILYSPFDRPSSGGQTPMTEG